MITIRKAVPEDAPGIAIVNAYTWKTAYAGLLPDEILDRRVAGVPKLAARWKTEIEKNASCLVAEEGRAIVGFCAYGKSRAGAYPSSGEIYAIYVLRGFQGAGAGRALFCAAKRELAVLGFRSMLLNCLKGNPSLGFYKHMGGEIAGERRDILMGAPIAEEIVLFQEIGPGGSLPGRPAESRAAMRRKDRQVTDPAEIESILRECRVFRLALTDGRVPYIVPLNFGCRLADGRLTLCFHCAKEGRKLDLLRQNSRVAFEMDCGHALLPGESACDYGFRYKSVLGTGEASVVSDTDEKKALLSLLMEQQTGKRFVFSDSDVESVTVCKIDVAEFSAKARIK